LMGDHRGEPETSRPDLIPPLGSLTGETKKLGRLVVLPNGGNEVRREGRRES
jgi:hypothetical protein